MSISGTRRKGRPAILVAEGNEATRALCIDYLARAGFDAVGTAVAAEAMASLRTGAWSVVVLDLELEALDLAELARVAASGVGALVLTCRTFARLPRPFSDAECVLKPCLPSSIVAAVMRALSHAARDGTR